MDHHAGWNALQARVFAGDPEAERIARQIMPERDTDDSRATRLLHMLEGDMLEPTAAIRIRDATSSGDGEDYALHSNMASRDPATYRPPPDLHQGLYDDIGLQPPSHEKRVAGASVSHARPDSSSGTGAVENVAVLESVGGYAQDASDVGALENVAVSEPGGHLIQTRAPIPQMVMLPRTIPLPLLRFSGGGIRVKTRPPDLLQSPPPTWS